MFVDTAYAMASPGGSGAQGASNPLTSFLPIILIFVVFYFFLIRPQQKKAKEHQKMLEALQKGDTVITTAGIVGTIVGFQDNMIEVKIAENVKVKMTRDAVAKKITTPEQSN